MLKTIITAALLASAAPVIAAPSDDLAALLKDHWAWYLKNSPEYATMLGVRTYDDKISDISLAAADRQEAEAKGLLDRLKAIPDSGLSPEDRTNKAILGRLLSEQIQANHFGERQILFTTYVGWYQNYAGLADNLPFRTRADYESYYNRLVQYPKLDQEAIAISRKALKEGFVQPCDASQGSEKAIIGVVTDKPEESRFYAPFLNSRPADMTEGEWDALKAKMRTLISGTLNPEYKRLYDFYMKDYLPKCRKTVGASAMPNGAAWYAFRVRQETTTDKTPEEIHQLGLSEVKRIRAEMEAVAKEAGFPSREAFIHELRTDPKYYAKTPEELLQVAAPSGQAHRRDAAALFRQAAAPDLRHQADPGRDGGRHDHGLFPAGLARERASPAPIGSTPRKLDQRPLLGAAGADRRMRRCRGISSSSACSRNSTCPISANTQASFTAYVEGWALYTERLGIEMGIYDTPKSRWAGCPTRCGAPAVWSSIPACTPRAGPRRRRSPSCTDNTALTDANIEAEVNRYITWPGQALGYKMGELKIRELRARAEAALGPKFDLRALPRRGARARRRCRSTCWIAQINAGSRRRRNKRPAPLKGRGP